MRLITLKRGVSPLVSTDDQSVTIGTLMLGLLFVVLVILIIILVRLLLLKLTRTDDAFYYEKNALNLRIVKTPTVTMVTTNCSDFKVYCADSKFVLSCVNPFGETKSSICDLIGDPVEKGFYLELAESEFKKLLFYLKPGPIAVFKHKIMLQYKYSVSVKKFKYMTKE